MGEWINVIISSAYVKCIEGNLLVLQESCGITKKIIK
jgi:hypothetical protein